MKTFDIRFAHLTSAIAIAATLAIPAMAQSSSPAPKVGDPPEARDMRLVGMNDLQARSAADIQIDGVSKWDIATYIRSLPDRGGVGTYCHTDSVHLDTGNARDWNWGCGRKSAPIPSARAI